jgi:hypothetical protein
MQLLQGRLRLVLLVLAFGAIFLAGRWAAGLREAPPDMGAISLALEREAAELNATLPEQVSETMRLDEATTGPGNAFTYHYTIVDADAAKELQRNFVKLDELKRQLEQRVCTMMPDYRVRKTVVGYMLRDEAGVALADISVNPQECR